MSKLVFLLMLKRPHHDEFEVCDAYSNTPSSDEVKESYCDFYAIDSVDELREDVDYKIRNMNVINN